MKQLIDILLERRDDNLHQFVEYIREAGKKGHAKSKCRNINDIKEFIFSHNGFDSSMLESDVTRALYQEYLKEYGKDNDYDFEEYLYDLAMRRILDNLSINNDGCIYIERVLELPEFNVSSIKNKEFRDAYKGKLGMFWTYEKNNGNAYFGYKNNPYQNITLKGYIAPEDVDWELTFANNINFEREKEITAFESADIQLDEITTQYRDHILLKGPLLYKA